jgi:hypothetical protein
MSMAGYTSPANRANTTSGTRTSRPTIRMGRAVMSSPMTEVDYGPPPVETRHAQSENDLAIADTRHARRRQQRAARNQRMRARRRLGLVMRTLPLQREWLDGLEERGYLDPPRRQRTVLDGWLLESADTSRRAQGVRR